MSAFLLRPWRCHDCGLRFMAWTVAVEFAAFAHCNLCGNMDLQRISREHGSGSFAWLYRMLHFPAYRCAPCRNRFFSIRVYRRIVPVQREIRSESEPHSAT